MLKSRAYAAWPYYNSRYIVYDSYEGLDPQEGAHLVLWDLQVDEEVRLAENTQGAEDVSISETHAAWVAWGGPDKDVFYVELATRQVTHVESTWDPWTAYATTWGDWVLWEDTRYGRLDIQGRRISTGEEVRVTDNGEYNGRPVLRGSVVCFRTSLWSNSYGLWDLAVYDLETQALRRVTTEQHFGYKCGYVDSGWLVYRKQMSASDTHFEKIFAVHLEKLGILDAQGHVVP